MSRSILRCAFAAALVFAATALVAEAKDPEFQKITVTTDFRSEGAAFGDFNKDGVMDVVSGHRWYAGPDFKVAGKIYEAEDNFDVEGYSNSFVNFVADFNGDGWDDVLICPHPGVTGYWYENPKGEDKLWAEHEATIELGNESQAWEDVDADGKPELIFNRNDWYGYAIPSWDAPNEPWKFVAVSPKDPKYQRYFHGNGVGDISGDGRADLLEMDGWWEQPEKATDVPWKFHEFHFADAASNMLAYDFDGDGLTDVVTAWHCHQYGLVFWKQVRGADGAISFKEQWLIPTEPGDDFSPKVSQMHALALGDFNGDGVMDFCTGKRRFAHGTKMDSDPMADPVLLWYETVRKDDGSVDFVPHVIDSDSGVGTQVMAQDANGDGIPDILVGNKRGVFVFMSK